MCFHTPEDSLHVVWLSYLAAVDLILFIFLGSFLLFCLIFFFPILQCSGNLHPSLERRGSSLSACTERRGLCQRCAIPIVG